MQRRVSRCRRFAAAFSFRRVSQGLRIASGGPPRPGKLCFTRETAAADASPQTESCEKSSVIAMIRMIGRQEYVLAQRIRAVMDGIRPLWRSPVLHSDWNEIKRKWRLNLKSAFLF